MSAQEPKAHHLPMTFSPETHYVIYVGMIRNEERSKVDFPYHYHEKGNELNYIVEGSAEVLIDGEAYPVREGDLIRLPHGRKHRITGKMFSYCLITFIDDVWESEYERKQMSRILGMRPDRYIVNVYDAPMLTSIPTIIREMLNEKYRHNELSVVYQKTKLNEILLAVHYYYLKQKELASESFQKHSTSEKNVLTVLNYLNENSHLAIPIEEAAEIAGLSRRHFSRVFHQLTNLSYRQYINKIRVAKAKELLVSALQENRSFSNMSICFEVGFEDPTTFYRAFKKHTSYTPSEFIKEREQHLAEKSS